MINVLFPFPYFKLCTELSQGVWFCQDCSKDLMPSYHRDGTTKITPSLLERKFELCCLSNVLHAKQVFVFWFASELKLTSLRTIAISLGGTSVVRPPTSGAEQLQKRCTTTISHSVIHFTEEGLSWKLERKVRLHTKLLAKAVTSICLATLFNLCNIL